MSGQGCRVRRAAGREQPGRRFAPTAQTLAVAEHLTRIAAILELKLPPEGSADHIETILDAIDRLPGEQQIALRAAIAASPQGEDAT
ncbi:hypothetical protein ACH5AU_30655 [Streptomyces albidoflavus]